MILTVTANPAVDIAYFVESFNMGAVHRPTKTVMTAGGKGLNVSRVVSIMGEAVTAMGFVGGINGSFIKSEASKFDIRAVFTEIKGETRKSIDIIDYTGRTGEILEAGPVICAEEEARFLKQFSDEIKTHEIVCLSGSLPQGLGGDFYCNLIKLAKEKNKKTITDTSGKALETVIQAKPYMIKPNKEELSRLLGLALDTDGEIKGALKILFDRGITVPFVTLGDKGAAAYDGKEFYRFNIPSIDVKNTVGSGDSTVAGLAVGLCRRMTLCDSIKLGMAAGMANTQYDQTGMVSNELIDKFYKDIKVETI